MSLPKLVFIDTNNELIDELTKKISGKFPEITVQIVKKDVRSFLEQPNTLFVSPANSQGDMYGGIDYVLSHKMFTEIQPIVHSAISSLNIQNTVGEDYLPVGSTIIVPVSTDNDFNQYLISAPTMLTSQDISGTDNCYHAMYAILRVAHKFNQYCQTNKLPQMTEIIIPGLGTGVGGITPIVASIQVYNAIDTFIKYDLKKLEPPQSIKKYLKDTSQSPYVFLNNYLDIVQEQKDTDENMFYFNVNKKENFT